MEQHSRFPNSDNLLKVTVRSSRVVILTWGSQTPEPTFGPRWLIREPSQRGHQEPRRPCGQPGSPPSLVAHAFGTTVPGAPCGGGGWPWAAPSRLDYISHRAVRPRPRFPQPLRAAPPPAVGLHFPAPPAGGGARRGGPGAGAAGGPGLGRPPPPWACRGGRLRDAAARRGAASAAAAVRRGPRASPSMSGGERGPGGGYFEAGPGGPAGRARPSSPHRLQPRSRRQSLNLAQRSGWRHVGSPGRESALARGVCGSFPSLGPSRASAEASLSRRRGRRPREVRRLARGRTAPRPEGARGLPDPGQAGLHPQPGLAC